MEAKFQAGRETTYDPTFQTTLEFVNSDDSFLCFTPLMQARHI